MHWLHQLADEAHHSIMLQHANFKILLRNHFSLHLLFLLIYHLHRVDAFLLLQLLDEVAVQDRGVEVLQWIFIKVCLQSIFSLRTLWSKEERSICNDRNVSGWYRYARIGGPIHPVEQALVVDLFFIVPETKNVTYSSTWDDFGCTHVTRHPSMISLMMPLLRWPDFPGAANAPTSVCRTTFLFSTPDPVVSLFWNVVSNWANDVNWNRISCVTYLR